MRESHVRILQRDSSVDHVPMVQLEMEERAPLCPTTVLLFGRVSPRLSVTIPKKDQFVDSVLQV